MNLNHEKYTTAIPERSTYRHDENKTKQRIINIMAKIDQF